MMRNDQDQTCTNAACKSRDTRNQALICGVSPMEGYQKKYKIQSDVRLLLEKNYKVNTAGMRLQT